jgi:peptidoglycan/LPS O-acetylase OafA/YrhL
MASTPVETEREVRRPPAEPVPDVVAPPPGNPRFPLFDSLRALAALAILVVHTAIFSESSESWYWRLVAHLDIGVPFFFLLSGFLLYRPMLAARILGTPAARLRVYARRRFLRIAPAYWVVLTLAAIVPGIYGVFSGNWWVYYGLLQNFPIYTEDSQCAADIFRCGIAPTWSLAIEVGFYIVLPFFALGMAWLGSRLRTRWLALELSALALVSLVSVAIQSYDGSGGLYQWLFFSPIGRAWWFALGMGLAAYSVWIQQRGSDPAAARWVHDHPGVPWLAAIGLYLFAALVVLDPGPSIATPTVGRVQYVGEYLLFGVIAALVLLPAIFGDDRGGLPRRVLAHPVLAWLGLVSYGIFLYSYPVMLGMLDIGVNDWIPSVAFVVLTLTTLAATLVCAALSYYLLERPLMRRK